MRRYGAELVWLPFDLHPEYPPEGVPRAILERHYGQGFLDHVRTIVESAGLEHSPPAMIPRSALSLELAELARDEGRYDEVHRQLFLAYWSEGRDIGNVEVLAAIAADAGVDADTAREVLEARTFAERVREATAAAQRLGVDGVPAWLIDRKALVLGAQPHDVFASALEELGYSSPESNDEG